MVKTTGNSTLKTKQHNAQSRSPASTPRASKKKQNINSEEAIQELLLRIKKLERKVEILSGEVNQESQYINQSRSRWPEAISKETMHHY